MTRLPFPIALSGGCLLSELLRLVLVLGAILGCVVAARVDLYRGGSRDALSCAMLV
jgi:hypothetical protein